MTFTFNREMIVFICSKILFNLYEKRIGHYVNKNPVETIKFYPLAVELAVVVELTLGVPTISG